MTDWPIMISCSFTIFTIKKKKHYIFIFNFLHYSCFIFAKKIHWCFFNDVFVFVRYGGCQENIVVPWSWLNYFHQEKNHKENNKKSVRDQYSNQQATSKRWSFTPKKIFRFKIEMKKKKTFFPRIIQKACIFVPNIHPVFDITNIWAGLAIFYNSQEYMRFYLYRNTTKFKLVRKDWC